MSKSPQMGFERRSDRDVSSFDFAVLRGEVQQAATNSGVPCPCTCKLSGIMPSCKLHEPCLVMVCQSLDCKSYFPYGH